jgi:hypothetical protein
MKKTNREEPTYYGILPAEIRYAKNISPMEKIMYAEISALASKTGKCWGSNGYFAELYDVQPTTVSEWINNLERAGYVSITGAKSKNRVITLVNILRKKPKTPKELPEAQPSEKVEHNNTSSNTINNKSSEQAHSSFNTELYLNSIMAKDKERKNYARYFSALYLLKKKKKYSSPESVEGALGQHLKFGKEIGRFISDPDKIQKAFKSAENYAIDGRPVDWSLKLVLKFLA